MKNSEKRKPNASINYLPSCEINGFLQSVFTQQSQNQKNNISIKTKVEGTAILNNTSNLPPSCEFDKPNKD